MLNLAVPTDEGWFERIVDELDTVLVDHAHLEKRAASTALSMIFRYTGRAQLPRKLSEVVQEEMDHFVRMLDLLETRGVAFKKLDPAPYAALLAGHARKQEPEALLDRLLIAALIEARSCERFTILSKRVDDPVLAAFYEELYESEARHHTLYTGLAREYFPGPVVKARLSELAEYEAQALRASSGMVRLHSW
ncbi:MAG: tRNA-(ms[2]io[6]A)-hydroxylase [Bradymonadaceae bacterium]|nr:tRNA-(ms[2]io[6]A)-hydroxylase [Lujinxingiaceae bacterium]